MRCLTLAEELRRRGCNVAFVVGPGTIPVVPALERSVFSIAEAQAKDWQTVLLGLVGRRSVDAIIVDDYSVDIETERAIRALTRCIGVIDDFRTRAHDCDVLLNQTLGITAADCAPVLPAGAKVLAGSRYALLRREFAEARAAALTRRREAAFARRIVVSMGLTDPGSLSWPISAAIAERVPDCKIDLILGSENHSLPSARELAERWPAIAVHVDPRPIANLLVDADVAIGAAGSSTWERCCLALPTVMVVLADNQQQIAANVASVGAAVMTESRDPGHVAALAAELLADASRRRSMAQAAAAICDGLGAARVADVLMGIVASRGPIG
jgi:UDP-2,4-diacetamido-2,4,6-trideoxy-beta-L-altropyranose hydrolase